MSTLKEKRRENDLYLHRSHLEDQARAQTELMREANRLAEKQAAAGSGGASTSSGDPVVGIVVLLVLAVIVAIIAIVVTYWAEILFAGLAVLAFHYRKPISRFVRRIAAACSGTQAEPEDLPPLEESPVEESVTAAQLCGNCRKPNIPPAPFCRHCGSHIAALPPQVVIPPPLLAAPSAIQQSPPPPTRPRIELLEINGWRRPLSERQMITVEGQQYWIYGQHGDVSHPDWVHYAMQGRDGRHYGVSVRNDGHQSRLIEMVVEDTPTTATAEPIKPGTRLNIPCRCSCTGQWFVYLCRFNTDGHWVIGGTDASQAAHRDAATTCMTDVRGSFTFGNDFGNACPHCREATSFLICRDCKVVSCNGMKRRKKNGKKQYWCGACNTWQTVDYSESVCVLDLHGEEQQPVSARKELVAQRAVVRQ